MRLSILLLFFISILLPLKAQKVPNSKVYAFKMNKKGGSYNFSNPKYLTAFNKDGYNNQPYFINNYTLYITVQFPDDSQTDIYALDLNRKAISRVTKTIESEYSATLMPDATEFSAVRVEADIAGTQRLWKFPLDRSTDGQVVFENLTGIGYHSWLGPQKVALFIVGEPHKLVIANYQTGASVELLNNIGRGFQNTGGEKLAFIHKVTDDTWYIKEMDSYTYRFKEVIQTLPKSEDFLYLKDGTFLMGNGSKLYKYNKLFDTNWKEIADFKYFGIKNITRLAISDNGTIAIVDQAE